MRKESLNKIRRNILENSDNYDLKLTNSYEHTDPENENWVQADFGRHESGEERKKLDSFMMNSLDLSLYSNIFFFIRKKKKIHNMNFMHVNLHNV